MDRMMEESKTITIRTFDDLIEAILALENGNLLQVTVVREDEDDAGAI